MDKYLDKYPNIINITLLDHLTTILKILNLFCASASSISHFWGNFLFKKLISLSHELVVLAICYLARDNASLVSLLFN